MFQIKSISDVALTISVSQDGKWKSAVLKTDETDFSDIKTSQISNMERLKLIKVTEIDKKSSTQSIPPKKEEPIPLKQEKDERISKEVESVTPKLELDVKGSKKVKQSEGKKEADSKN